MNPSPLRSALLGGLAGALLLCLLSAFQKMIIDAPVVPRGFIIPALFGTLTGILLGLWRRHLIVAYRSIYSANAKLRQETRERLLAENELRQMHHQYELIVNSMAEGVVGMDLDSRVIFANRAAQKMLGYSEEDLLGACLHKKTHYARPDGSPYPKEECPLHGSPPDTLVRRDEDDFWNNRGDSLPVRYVRSAMIDNGTVIGSVLVFSDETERRHAAEALRRSQRNYRNIVENAPVGIFQSTPEGRYLSANSRMAGLCPYNAVKSG